MVYKRAEANEKMLEALLESTRIAAECIFGQPVGTLDRDFSIIFHGPFRKGEAVKSMKLFWETLSLMRATAKRPF